MSHHRKHCRREHIDAGIYNLPIASIRTIEAAIANSPMLRESLDEAVSCAQIEYDQQQYENEVSMGNPVTR